MPFFSSTGKPPSRIRPWHFALAVVLAPPLIYQVSREYFQGASTRSNNIVRLHQDVADPDTTAHTTKSGRRIVPIPDREKELLARFATLPPSSAPPPPPVNDGTSSVSRVTIDRILVPPELATLYATNDPDKGVSWILSITDPEIRGAALKAFAKEVGRLRTDGWRILAEKMTDRVERDLFTSKALAGVAIEDGPKAWHQLQGLENRPDILDEDLAPIIRGLRLEDVQHAASVLSPATLQNFFDSMTFPDQENAVALLQTIPDETLRMECLRRNIGSSDGPYILETAKAITANPSHPGSRDRALLAIARVSVEKYPAEARTVAAMIQDEARRQEFMMENPLDDAGKHALPEDDSNKSESESE